jgi:hypothetical protein
MWSTLARGMLMVRITPKMVADVQSGCSDECDGDDFDHRDGLALALTTAGFEVIE